MIDASTLATAYGAFWAQYAPTCEHFVRDINLGGSERYYPPFSEEYPPANAAVVAEAGFQTFSLLVAKRASTRSAIKPAYVDSGLEAARMRLSGFSTKGLDLDSPLSEEERKEIEEIAARILGYCSGTRSVDTVSPLIHGCGFVDSSEADIFCRNSELIEIKTVSRKFRSSDVRQLLSYLSLNFASGQFNINSVSLFNPRSGLYFHMNVDDFCFHASGKFAEEMLSDIVAAISDGGISR